MSEITFLDRNWAQKSQNSTKAISQSWLTPQNNRKELFTVGGLRFVIPLRQLAVP